MTLTDQDIKVYRKKLHSIIDQIYDNSEKGQDYNKLENLAICDFYDLTFELLTLLANQNIASEVNNPTKRYVFKKNAATKEMVKVGTINELNRVTLDTPPDFNINCPSLYRGSWYIKDPNLVDYFMSLKPEGLITIMGEKAIQNEIIITRRGNSFTTGVITIDGKAIYYDQYL